MYGNSSRDCGGYFTEAYGYLLGAGCITVICIRANSSCIPALSVVTGEERFLCHERVGRRLVSNAKVPHPALKAREQLSGG